MMNNDEHDPGSDPSGPRRGALLALVVVVALLACSWWLEQRMRANGSLEDCLMSGRRNCAPITQ